MKRLLDFVEERKALDREGFLALHPVPVLLHHLHAEDDDQGRSFKTAVTDPSASRLELATGLTTDPDLLVIPVEKRPGGVFRDRVGVGRTRNNDIQLPYPKVSKFHAYFTWNGDGSEYHLTDAGSTNGTFVNGHRLETGVSVVIADRNIVSFGRYHFRFHLPEGLWSILGRIAYGSDAD